MIPARGGGASWQLELPRPLAAVTVSESLELPEHWQLTANTFHVEKVRPYILREGQPRPPPRPRRFTGKARRGPGPPGPDNPRVGTIRRIMISAHRRTGRIQADGQHKQLQYLVHWDGLPLAYG
jgi:hypothetical protein